MPAAARSAPDRLSPTKTSAPFFALSDVTATPTSAPPPASCTKAAREARAARALHDRTGAREAEGARITLQEGFDAASVRLTGNVVGKAPFTGA
jgi:hypothetical protein